MSIAFGSLYYIVLDETAGYGDVRLLLGLVGFSVFSVVYWAFTDDLRIYAFVQGYFLLTIPVYYILFSERVRYENYKQLFVSLGFYALAKITEKFDKQVFALTGRTISGHTLKHLLAGVATGWGILILQQRRQ